MGLEDKSEGRKGPASGPAANRKAGRSPQSNGSTSRKASKRSRPNASEGTAGLVRKSTVKVEFRRDLGLLDITMVGIGTMIGAGIFVLSGIAAGYAGPATIIAFLLNGIINLITGMTYAELGSAYPKAGGGYQWVRKGLPHPFGFVSGWISWFGHTVACSLYALGFGTYMAWLLEEYHVGPFPANPFLGPDKAIAVIVCVALLYINYRGRSVTGRSETFFTMSKIVLLFTFLGFGAFAMVHNPAAMDNLFGDFFPKGTGGILYAMSITLIAFQGYEVIAQTGEEVKNPKKNIPRAIFISVSVVTVIYILMIVVLFGVVTGPILDAAGMSNPSDYLGSAGASGELALLEVAKAAIGPVGVSIILLGGFLSTLSGLNATIFSSSRVSFAMGRDGTLPSSLGAVHGKRRTPHNAIAASGAILILMVAFFPIKTVAGVAGVMFLVLFAITNAAGIALRYKMPHLERGFKVPLFPLLPGIAVILNLALIYPLYKIEPLAVYLGVVWIMVGAYVYFFTGAKKDILEEPFKIKEMPATVPEEVARRYRVLVPVAFMEHSDMVDLGALIAKDHCGDLSLLSIIEAPGTTPASAIPYSAVKGPMDKMEALERRAKALGVPVDARLLISREVASTIIDAASSENANLVMLGWHGATRKGAIMGTNIDRVATAVHADVIVFKWRGMKPTVEQVLVLSGDSPHSDEAVRLAAIYAEHHRAEATLLTFSRTEKLSDEEQERLFRHRRVLAERGLRVRLKVLEAADTLRTMKREAHQSDILFMGALDEATSVGSLFGSHQDRIVGAVPCPVVIYRRAKPASSASVDKGPAKEGCPPKVPDGGSDGPGTEKGSPGG